ncbi:MAG: hypothetical protein ACXV5Q_00690 [Frankiaceae bacterium]
MSYSAISTPSILTSPGALFIAPLGTAMPANTVTAGVFSADWSTVPAWLPLGATEDGTNFSYQTTVAPIDVAEFLDPIQYATTERAGSIAFNLASFTLSNYNRALNGGVAALTPTTGTGATALYTVQPPTPGSETRCMIGWESLDHTVRFVAYQAIQGGQIQTAFKKAPAIATIPCTFNMEIPSTGVPFTIYSAGGTRA